MITDEELQQLIDKYQWQVDWWNNNILNEWKTGPECGYSNELKAFKELQLRRNGEIN